MRKLHDAASHFWLRTYKFTFVSWEYCFTKLKKYLLWMSQTLKKVHKITGNQDLAS